MYAFNFEERRTIGYSNERVLLMYTLKSFKKAVQILIYFYDVERISVSALQVRFSIKCAFRTNANTIVAKVNFEGNLKGF